MVVISTALVLADEAAAEGSVTSPYIIGAFAFVALSVLLVVTMMIKVGRD
jgi:hypothetical protein